MWDDQLRVNNLGTNIKIKITDDENLLSKNGFFRCESTGEIPSNWFFYRDLGKEISFCITKYDKPYKDCDLQLVCIDEDFGQPYDYYYILSVNSKNPVAREVFEKVEKIMANLTEAGVISGHKYGEYI